MVITVGFSGILVAKYVLVSMVTDGGTLYMYLYNMKELKGIVMAIN